MACGAPTIAGDNSSLQEILPREARFQPSDPGAIAEAITRGLTDKPFRERLIKLAGQTPPTWAHGGGQGGRCVRGTVPQAGGYRPAWRRRPYLALVGVPDELADGPLALTPASTGDAEPRPAVPTGDKKPSGR